MHTCIPVLYACIPAFLMLALHARRGVAPPRLLWGVGPAGTSGIWGHKHVGESGPLSRELGQARRGAGPTGSAGSQARSQTSRAHRHITQKTVDWAHRLRRAPMGELGLQARRGVGGRRLIGDSRDAGSSGVGPTGSSGRMVRQHNGLPDLGARRKWWNCNVARNSSLGVYRT